MSGKHTPGPWYTDTGGDVTRIDGTTLLTREKPYDCTIEESFANAAVGAAAPDLLAALTKFVVKHRRTYGLGGAWDDELLSGEAAIAKATGE